MKQILFNILFFLLITSCQSDKNTLRNKYFAKSDKKSIPEKREVKSFTLNDKRSDLNEFLDTWIGTPYEYGGNDRSGIDCSAFTSRFYKDVLNLDLLRTTKLQFEQGHLVNKSSLKLGDLIFFRINGPRSNVDHVGVYLNDGNFVHASTSNGVTISNLNEHYFSERYTGSKRLSGSN